MGVLYPQFDTENAAQIPTSFGGLVFMMAAVSLLTVIIMVEAWPVAQQLRTWQLGEPAAPPASMIFSMIAVAGICALASLIPVRLALKRLASVEG
jgi:ABC-2 type transport system permease protein